MEMGNFTDYNPGSHVIHGQEVNITCEPRYAVIHNATPVSCNNGTWTHVPVCAPARCRQLPDKPKNGLVIAPKTDHGMKALFLCRDGYQLAGPNVTECYYGEWTLPTPICKESKWSRPHFVHGSTLLCSPLFFFSALSASKNIPFAKSVCECLLFLQNCVRF
ncbi:uncharacterized protein TNIN_296801 [Trichonephila inaurata madagascariensis]|uniref:Sushi domain-containing protein n=1 Tax=Trichonephila inaurata madagascariensis TaxID=2747483 RepID=A0A8X6YVT9_9ARAC|nr:uncharacterized protein TNIN_296801 [Trichonephila inaurata madagascariensis]